MNTNSSCTGDHSLLSESHNRFANDLYLATAKNAEGNVFFSPFSISVALAMTHVGAKGKTAEELRSSLHLPDDLEGVKKSYSAVLDDVQKPSEEYELRTSNRAYVSHVLSVLDSYSSSLVKDFKASLHKTDFSKSEEARTSINERVEDDTNKRIKNLISPGILNSLTRMVLVNAIFFKGLWHHKFDEKMTKDKKFWLSEKESVDVPMMSIKKKFRFDYVQDLKARRLAMDYKGERLSFVIVLPDSKEGLKDVEATMESFKFSDVRGHENDITVELPRFKMEETLDLGSILTALGINDLFCDSSCDLSGISTDKPAIFVSKVIHKAFLEVNEEGSEAAAATAVMMMTRCMRPEASFLVDRPFLFYILDKTTNMPLFVGKFVKP